MTVKQTDQPHQIGQHANGAARDLAYGFPPPQRLIFA